MMAPRMRFDGLSSAQAINAPDMYDALADPSAEGARCRELMLHMAVNHSVLLDEKKELSASSPDEQAFVAAAEQFGFEFLERHEDEGYLLLRNKQTGATERVEVLSVFAYESSRKRMSIVVKLTSGLAGQVGGVEQIRLYSKGADSVMLTLLMPGSRGADAAALGALNKTLHEWADVALRTLVFAKREIGEAEWAEWYVHYQAATSSPAELAKMRKGLPNEIGRLQMTLEKDLTLQGATAIEDKLQDGVPEVLQDLRTAGIKVWMLTGDKVGTAKNIAMACNILPPDAAVLEITTETFPVSTARPARAPLAA